MVVETMQVKNIKLKDNSKVKAFKIITQKARPGKIFAGSKETNSYLIIDEFWNSFIELLNKPLALSEISEKLTKKDPQNFEVSRSLSKVKIMMVYFIQNKLIKEIDGETIYEPSQQRAIKDKTSNRLILIVAIPVLIFAFLSLIALLKFFPKPADFFWSSYFSLCILSSFVFTWIAALMHEGAHLLIGRLYKIRGKLRLSHRLNYLVVETYFPDIYSVPKWGRIAIYISGIIVDMATVSVLYIWVFLFNSPIVKQFILLGWLSILWQFFFFMKTDIYFAIRELVGVENLYSYARLKFLNIFKRKKTQFQLNEKENNIVKVYAIFMVVGSFVGLFRYGFYHIPIIFALIIGSFQKILYGIMTNNVISFFDCLAVILIEAILNVLLITTFFRRRV